jgi:methylenetetrahydrofolate dehydrogenase (NADP+)/methenyltetrahydrofolate cyclohydrolase
VLLAIPPEKDVDGFHPVNVGRLSTAQEALVPCTPLGSLRLLDEAGVELRGANAIVIGRSNIVGKPMAQLLLARDATVTVAHSRTKDLAALCRTMDVVIAAVGRAEMVKADWLKPGAAVIDVGINRIETPDGKGRLVGDVAFAECREVAGCITPVPGGVGPMTIALLLQNTLTAARARGR